MDKLFPGFKVRPKTYAYDLWRHMHDEHGLTLLESELSEIIDIIRKGFSAEESDPCDATREEPKL